MKTSLGVKGENNESSYPLVAVHSRQKQTKTKKKQATQTSEERKTSGTSSSAPHCTLLFASLGPSENFTQSSCNKQLSLSLKAINP